jgi:transposase
MAKLVLTVRHRRQLERQLQQTHDVRLYRRTLAILECDRGQSIAEIARTLRVSRRSVHRWIHAYSRSFDPESLADDDRQGRPPRWTEECFQWLQAFLRHSPAELGYYAVNWTVPLLQDPLMMVTGQRFSSCTVRRGLRRLGYVWKRARYVLAPDPEREKKTSNPPRNLPFAAAQRSFGRGRDRFVVVSSIACQLESERRAELRFAVGEERSASCLWGHESPHREAAVFGSSASEAAGFSGVLEAHSRALPCLACGSFAGREPKPHRSRLPTVGQRAQHAIALAA